MNEVEMFRKKDTGFEMRSEILPPAKCVSSR